MKLEKVKIEGDKITLYRDELQWWCDHYYEVSFNERLLSQRGMLYVGKHDVLLDILKLFGEKEEHELGEKNEAILDALIRRLEGEDVYVSPHLAVECLKSLKERVGCEANCTTTKEWSEEDEQHVDSLLKRLDALCRNKFERTRFAISEDKDWLLSLKGRVQPKQEWSEEDSQYIDDAFTLIGFGLSTHTTGEVQEWLLSLKGRVKPQWKPSDEQMEALYKASKNEYLKADQYDVLSELWNNLKKLKE